MDHWKSFLCSPISSVYYEINQNLTFWSVTGMNSDHLRHPPTTLDTPNAPTSNSRPSRPSEMLKQNKGLYG